MSDRQPSLSASNRFPEKWLQFSQVFLPQSHEDVSFLFILTM